MMKMCETYLILSQIQYRLGHIHIRCTLGTALRTFA